jgi:hypothetical protein
VEAGRKEEEIMRKFLVWTVSAVVFCASFIVASDASAEEAEERVVIDRDRTPEEQACMQACLDGSDPSVVPECVDVRGDIEAIVQELARRRQSARRGQRWLRGQLDGLNGGVDRNAAAIRDIENRLQVLVRLEGFYRDLLESMAAMNDRVGEVVARLGQLEDRMDDLEESDAGQTVAIAANTTAVRRLAERVTTLEERRSRRIFQLGFQGGGAMVYSVDRTLYSFGFVGVRLGFHARENLDVVLDAQVALSGGEQPVGARVAGGLAIEFLNNRLRLDVGAEAIWAGYDSHADAGSLFVLGGLGLEYRPHRVVGLGVRVMPGLEMDPERTVDFAIGGLATLSFYLPRW